MTKLGSHKALLTVISISLGLLYSTGIGQCKNQNKTPAPGHRHSAEKRLIAQALNESTEAKPDTLPKTTQAPAKRNAAKKVSSLSVSISKAKTPPKVAASTNSATKPASSGQQPQSQRSSKTVLVQAPANSVSAAPQPVPVDVQSTEADTALVSILRDIVKGLRESEEASKLENSNDKLALNAALTALERALNSSPTAPNRIVAIEAKDRFSNSVSAQTWESGEIPLPDGGAASLNVLWAKKVNGLINVSIAGSTTVKQDDGNKKPLEFVVVINGKSALDSGFDIQSQSNVNFWLGKLSNFTIDAGAPGAPQASASEHKILHALMRKNYLVRQAQTGSAAPVAEAADTAKKPISQEQATRLEPAVQNKIVEIREAAKVAAQPINGPLPEPTKTEEVKLSQKLTEEALPSAGSRDHEPATSSSDSNALVASAPTVSAATEPPVTTSTSANQPGLISSMPPVELPGSAKLAKTTASAVPATPRTPSDSAQIVYPEKAVAGENITVAVLSGKDHKPEGNVTLSFNGTVQTTAADGRASFQIPEEAPPGPSLQITLAAKPNSAPAAVHVLQPLLKPSTPQVPHIDRVSNFASAGDLVTIEGHNFNGLAEQNHVILDARQEAKIIVSSPVQLKVLLPETVAPGHHAVTVASNGLTSNEAKCEAVSVQVQPMGKPDKANKWLVKVVGTQNKVKLRLLNNSPNVVKLARGNEQTVVTPGGSNNLVMLNAQRIGRGAVKLTTNVEPLQ